MFIQSRVRKIIQRAFLVILPLFVSACFSHGNDSAPSLNADDVWDKMESMSKEPLSLDAAPKMGTATDDAAVSERPKVEPLMSQDKDESRHILEAARGKYSSISTSLDQAIAAAQHTAEPQQDSMLSNGQITQSTIEFYLSRLLILQKNTQHAVAVLDAQTTKADSDEVQLNIGRDLLRDMAKRIEGIRAYLNKSYI